MATPEPLLVAKGSGSREIDLLPALANRHGLVAGATGTGKTVTLRVLAEAFSRIGVPSFLADVKGDLSGLARPGVTRTRSWPARRSSGSPSPPRPRRWSSSTFSARPGTRSAPPSPRWGRSSSRGS